MNGSYRHTMDAKGRLFIPAKLRTELGERFYVTKGLDGCLFVYSSDSFKDISERLSSLPLAKARNLQRMLFAGATDVELDAQGRIVVPQALREYASLSLGSEAVVAGVGGRAEIWDAVAWDRLNGSMLPDDMAAAMDEVGF